MAISGGVSDPRNSVLMKMFNFLNIGERAGSGIPNIFNVWEKENFGVPRYEETMNESRTKLSLPIEYASNNSKTSDKRAINASDKNKLILDIMENGVKYKTNDIADVINLSPARTRVYLKELVDTGTLKSDGKNKNRVYYLPED